MTQIFIENREIYAPGKRGAYQSLEVKDHIYRGKSDYQSIGVFDNESFGRVLTLDNIVQLTTSDEYIYHEMLVHVPMQSHRLEQDSVLIVGGGDCMAAREVLKYPVNDVTLVEIDNDVVRAAKNFFGMGDVQEDTRLTIINSDAAAWLREKQRKQIFDVAIIDGTDPDTSGGREIYNQHFLASLVKVMAHGGVIAMNFGVPFLQGVGHIQRVDKFMRFMRYTPYHYAITVPSIYGGPLVMGLYMSGEAMRGNPSPFIPSGPTDGLRHYSPDVREAAFVLPFWLREMLYVE